MNCRTPKTLLICTVNSLVFILPCWVQVFYFYLVQVAIFVWLMWNTGMAIPRYLAPKEWRDMVVFDWGYNMIQHSRCGRERLDRRWPGYTCSWNNVPCWPLSRGALFYNYGSRRQPFISSRFFYAGDQIPAPRFYSMSTHNSTPTENPATCHTIPCRFDRLKIRNT